jgi:dTDP-4-amino-4,6-dideoxygalactose transaminase
MDKILSICKENNLLLFEDCSHAHGARFQDKVCGSIADVSAWSIQGPKNVTGGEGGVLTCDNTELYYKALLLGHYNKRCRQEIPKDHPLAKYATTGMGLKYRAHPLAVKIADLVFKDLDNTIKIRENTFNTFKEELGSIEGLRVQTPGEGNKISGYAIIVHYDKDKFEGLSIDKLYESLKAEGLDEVDIPTSTSPLNLLPLFQTPEELFPSYKNPEISFSYKKGDFPKAEKYYSSTLKIPVWVIDGEKNAKIYAQGFKKVLGNYKELL